MTEKQACANLLGYRLATLLGLDKNGAYATVLPAAEGSYLCAADGSQTLRTVRLMFHSEKTHRPFFKTVWRLESSTSAKRFCNFFFCAVEKSKNSRYPENGCCHTTTVLYFHFWLLRLACRSKGFRAWKLLTSYFFSDRHLHHSFIFRWNWRFRIPNDHDSIEDAGVVSINVHMVKT